MYTINIGLANPFTKGFNTVDFTLDRAMQFIGDIVDLKVMDSETEPTLVIKFKHIERSLLVLATALDQDCIALYDHDTNTGKLIGDKAAEWGAFNPEFFLTI